MDNASKIPFAKKWIEIYSAITYRDMAVDHPSIKVAYNLMKGFEFDVVSKALDNLAATTTDGFMPPPGAVLELLQGPPLTNEILMGMALSDKKTVLGSYVLQRVGYWNLKNLHGLSLKTHMETLRADIDNFIDDYKRGVISDSDRRLISACGHDGTEPLRLSLGERERSIAVAHYEGPTDPKVRNLISGVAGKIS